MIFLLPQSSSTSFMETLVFSLFDYGSGSREAFLLLRLFTQALQQEIRSPRQRTATHRSTPHPSELPVCVCVISLKVEKPQDVVTGNPMVVKMLVNFYRHVGGQNALRDCLGPALQDLLLDRGLSIRTDPVEVYKAWINLSETQTGCKRCRLAVSWCVR